MPTKVKIMVPTFTKKELTFVRVFSRRKALKQLGNIKSGLIPFSRVFFWPGVLFERAVSID